MRRGLDAPGHKGQVLAGLPLGHGPVDVGSHAGPVRRDRSEFKRRSVRGGCGQKAIDVLGVHGQEANVATFQGDVRGHGSIVPGYLSSLDNRRSASGFPPV